ncbi:MAG: thiamine pyrophosphate-binding protein, partial [Candidatus Limnocylindrales bacterium]
MHDAAGASGRRSTGGRAVVETLAAGGVEHAFTVPGESFLGVLDALYDSTIQTIATRHEAGAGFMAEAYGQLTGRPAAVLVTRAVGAANLAIALHTARQDSAPLVAVVGQVPRAFRGREAFQEVDQVATFGALCKAAIEVDDPDRLATETARLLGIARAGRPGPVLIALPEDVLEAEVSS